MTIQRGEDRLYVANARAADSLLDVLIGWDLPDQPLTPGTAMQLIDELPAAGLAILSAYREAITEGRLGN